MSKGERRLRTVGRLFGYASLCAAVWMGISSYIVCGQWPIIPALVCAYIAGGIFGSHSATEDFYDMRDQAERALTLAEKALKRDL